MNKNRRLYCKLFFWNSICRIRILYLSQFINDKIFRFNGSLIIMFFLFTCSSKQIEGQKINGVNLVSPAQPITIQDIEPAKQIGANWISVIPYAFTNPSQGQVSFGDDAGYWWGEKPNGTKTLISYAKKLGFKIMIKPHLWVRGQGWAGDLTFTTDVEWERWEKEYTDYVLTYASIAQQFDCEMLCIGTELRQSVKLRPFYWKKLIQEIKQIYHGKLTYAANWDNFENVTFWKEIDYIGIDAYFPLSSEKNPSIETIILSWESISEKLSDYSNKIKKSILFTEYGYRSVDFSTKRPWETDRSDMSKANEISQTNAYKALYQSVWSKDWMIGGFLWKWYPTPMLDRRPKPLGFTPQGKDVEGVIKLQYSD